MSGSARGRGRPGHDERGLSSVVGYALVLGITVLVVATTLLLGGMALTDVQGEANFGKAQQAMVHLDSVAADVALGSSPRRTMSLGTRAGEVTVASTGRFVLRTENGTQLLDQQLGTVRYEQRDGVVAYQGGGVWRGTGRESRMVSPPEFHYRQGTLTLPLVLVRAGGGTTAGDQVVMEAGEKRPGLGPGSVTNVQLEVAIESEYYAAWGQYMEERIRDVDVTYDHAADRVVAELGRLRIDGDYSTGVVGSGDVSIKTSGADVVETRIRSGGDVTDDSGGGGAVQCDAGTGSQCWSARDPPLLTELDSAIEQLVQNAETDQPDANVGSGPRTLGAGSYYSDGFDLSGGSLTLDLSSGNVTVFVSGNIGVNNQRIRVVDGAGTNHYAKIFTTGDFAMAKGNAGVTVDSGNATRFQLFGTSETQFAMGQSNKYGYTGTIYAPRDDSAVGSNGAVDEYGLNSATCDGGVDVCFGKGSGTIRGAVIGGDVSFEQSTSFEYDEDLAGLQPTLPADADFAPPLTYLHVSTNELTVSGPAPVGTPAGTAPPTPAPPATATATPPPTSTPGGTPAPTPLSASLSIAEQGNSGKFTFDASGSTPSGDIDQYWWDYDADGTVDDSSTAAEVQIDCKALGNSDPPPYCAEGGEGRVVVVAGDGRSAEATVGWP